jgi:UDP-N-acetylmuramoyl-tripeptide--D-alanyl-D-alanine ligase
VQQGGAIEPALDSAGKTNPAPLLEVPDVLKALQDLAAWYRKQFSIPVIGITGSTGKTSTKDLLAAVLGPRYNTLKTSGNYNNELGVPLTLLQLTNKHQAAVVEMGMRGLGEIASLCQIAAPTLGVITNIGHTHQELLGTQDNIALAKGELLESLPADGWAVLNADDPWQVFLGQRCGVRAFYYGLQSATADIYATDLRSESNGSRFKVHLPQTAGEVWLPVPGQHNVTNALAALGAGWLLGMQLEEMTEGLAKAQLSAMRLSINPGIEATTIINDAYNANPDSMLAALNVLSDTAGSRRIAVLGEMYELGDYAETGHRLVGTAAARLGVSCLLAVGKLAEHIAQGAREAGMPKALVATVPDNQQAIRLLEAYLQPGDVVLVKGSRGMHMEEIVAALQPQPQDAAR